MYKKFKQKFSYKKTQAKTCLKKTVSKKFLVNDIAVDLIMFVNYVTSQPFEDVFSNIEDTHREKAP